MNSAAARLAKPATWLCLLVSVGLASSGCVTRGPLHRFGFGFGWHQPCELPPNLSALELISYVNRNSMRLQSWRSSDVKIYPRSRLAVTGWVSAYIAVERPRNFRLMGSVLGRNAVDLGSNDENFWFWIRDAQPEQNFLARHDELSEVQQRLQIPFQPDWLMEVLGVVPIDEGEFSMQTEGMPEKTARLVSDRMSPQGELVRKVIVVDLCYGRLLEHALYDAHGRLVARAVFSNHQRDAATGIELPHQIDLDWPAEGLALTMEIGQIEVNPGPMPAQTWQPHIPQSGVAPAGGR